MNNEDSKDKPEGPGQKTSFSWKKPSLKTVFIVMLLLVFAYSCRHVITKSYRVMLYRLDPAKCPRKLYDIDFRTYMTAAHMLRDGNMYIYKYSSCVPYFHKMGVMDPNKISITYPPTLYMLMIPFTFIPLDAATDVWVIIKLTAILWSAIMLTYLVLGGKSQWRAKLGVAAVIFSAILFSGPAMDDIFCGNMNTILLFLFVTSLYLIKTGKEIPAGIVLGLIFSIKLVSLLILVYYVVRKRWKIVIPAVMVIIVLYLSVVIFLDPVLISDWYSTLFGNLQKGKYLSIVSIMLRLMYTLLGRPDLARNLYFFISFLCLAVLFMVFIQKKNAPEEYHFSLALATTLMVAPLVWPMYHVWLFIPLVFIAKDLFSRKFRKARDWLLLIYVLILYFFIVHFEGIASVDFSYETFELGLPTYAHVSLWILLVFYPVERFNAGIGNEKEEKNREKKTEAVAVQT